MSKLAFNRSVPVDPPAARICQDCGHVEKVEKVLLVAKQRHRCENCESTQLCVDRWENVADDQD